MSSCHHRARPKVKHQSKAAAYEHLKEAQPHRLELMQVYRCPYCRYWHVGRRPGAKHTKHEMRLPHLREEMLVGRLIGILKIVINRTN